MPLKTLGRMLGFLLSFQCVKIKGQPANSKEAPVVCVAPHSTFFDTIVLFYCSDIPSSLSRAENNSVPIISGTSLASYVSLLFSIKCLHLKSFINYSSSFVFSQMPTFVFCRNSCTVYYKVTCAL